MCPSLVRGLARHRHWLLGQIRADTQVHAALTTMRRWPGLMRDGRKPVRARAMALRLRNNSAVELRQPRLFKPGNWSKTFREKCVLVFLSSWKPVSPAPT